MGRGFDLLHRGSLCAELARHTAGRLSFAAWAVYGPRIRSRLKNLYHLASGTGDLQMDVLKEDAAFLLGLVLDSSLFSHMPLLPDPSPPIVIFSDVEGYGGCGAVLVQKDLESALARFSEVPEAFRRRLKSRKTQIVAFELVAPCLALWTWRHLLAGRRVIFFIDNNSALAILRRGSSKKADLNHIVSHLLRPSPVYDVV